MTDELRAKFEVWVSAQDWLRATLGLCQSGDEYTDPCINSRWQGWQAAHASRDAEVEALKRDAQRYKLLRSGKSDIPLPLGAEALDIYLDRRLADMAKEQEDKCAKP